MLAEVASPNMMRVFVIEIDDASHICVTHFDSAVKVSLKFLQISHRLQFLTFVYVSRAIISSKSDIRSFSGNHQTTSLDLVFLSMRFYVSVSVIFLFIFPAVSLSLRLLMITAF